MRKIDALNQLAVFFFFAPIFGRISNDWRNYLSTLAVRLTVGRIFKPCFSYGKQVIWCSLYLLLSSCCGIKLIFRSLCPGLFVWGGPLGKTSEANYTFRAPFGLVLLLGVLTIDVEIAGMLGYSEDSGCMVLNIRRFVLVP